MCRYHSILHGTPQSVLHPKFWFLVTSPNFADSLGPSLTRGVGGLEPKNMCTKKWPKLIFPFVNFIISHYETWVQGGGGSKGGYPSAPLGPSDPQIIDQTPRPSRNGNSQSPGVPIRSDLHRPPNNSSGKTRTSPPQASTAQRGSHNTRGRPHRKEDSHVRCALGRRGGAGGRGLTREQSPLPQVVVGQRAPA